MIKRKKRIAFAAVCAALILGFLLYAGIYYHADEAAAAAMGSDGTVTVTRTDYGWLLDGPSADDALVFYPGAKVEETAYMPLLHRLAAEGMDVCLVKMPLRFAFFAPNRADDLIEEYGYSHWYIGGHSLGGAIAANYAAGHPELLDGVILLAALGGQVHHVSIDNVRELGRGMERESVIKVFTGYGDGYRPGDLHHIRVNNVTSKKARSAFQCNTHVADVRVNRIIQHAAGHSTLRPRLRIAALDAKYIEDIAFSNVEGGIVNNYGQ